MNARTCILIGLTGCAMTAIPARATDYVSAQNGIWTNAATWDGAGWPSDPGDTATVAHTVTVDTDIDTIASITVTGTGDLRFYNPDGALVTTQNIAMADGAILSTLGPGGWTGPAANVYGTVSVSGTATFSPRRNALHIHSVISGTADIVVSGQQNDDHQRSVYLGGDNTFDGDILYDKHHSYLDVGHIHALGTKPELTVRVERHGAGRNSARNQLNVVNSSVFPTNVVHVIVEGADDFPSMFRQGRGTIVSNKVTLSGALYGFVAEGSGDRYSRGEIVLVEGTVSQLTRWAGAGADRWYQQGTITGAGSLYVHGGDGNAANLYFNGDNTYAGGTRIHSVSYGQSNRTMAGSDTAFGTGPIWLDATLANKEALQLTTSLTFANNIRGRGNINTGSHWLTVTGSLSPFDTGYGEPEKVAGPQTDMGFIINNMKFGTDTVSATYYWQYDNTTNDFVQCSNIEFGAAAPILVAEWLGDGDPRTEGVGEYTLFTYSGENPVMPEWIVEPPPKMRGQVRLDTDTKRVVFELTPAPPRGTVLRFQ